LTRIVGLRGRLVKEAALAEKSSVEEALGEERLALLVRLSRRRR
jgi:hypothetical protein